MATSRPIQETTTELEGMLDNINHLIEDNLPKNLHRSHIESSNAEQFKKQLDDYDTFLTEIKQLLSTSKVIDHQLLWLDSLGYLAGILLKLKLLFGKFYLHIPFYEIEPIFEMALALNSRVVYFTGEFGELFSKWLLNEDASLQLYSNNRINQILSELLIDSMELLIVDEMVDSVYPSTSYLVSIQYFLVRYSNWSTQEKKSPVDWFPILTQFTRVAYLFGESYLLVPLLDLNVYEPEIPINIISGNQPVNLVDVMNFYRFTAYNLITISLQAEPPKVIDSYNRLADIYLKILLSFPNLNLNAYSEIKLEQQGETGYTAPPPHGGERGFAPPGGFKDKREDFIMSISERQELSLMYILNSLLSLRSITKFVNTSPLYKSELSFLAKSLSSSLSRDIDELASQPTSTHSSVVSFPQLNQLEKEKSLDFMQRKMINKSKFKSISSVLIHGSYKEKLGNIVKLCNFLNDGNLTIPALCQKYHSTISESTHGTESLRFAVEAVLKLLILLSLEKISNGVNSISVVNLRKLFFIDGSIEDVFKVKKVLDYEIQVQNGDEVLVLSKNKGVKSMDLIIQDQLEINRLSQKLKELTT